MNLTAYQLGVLSCILDQDIQQSLKLQQQAPEVEIFATAAAETRLIRQCVQAAMDKAAGL